MSMVNKVNPTAFQELKLLKKLIIKNSRQILLMRSKLKVQKEYNQSHQQIKQRSKRTDVAEWHWPLHDQVQTIISRCFAFGYRYITHTFIRFRRNWSFLGNGEGNSRFVLSWKCGSQFIQFIKPSTMISQRTYVSLGNGKNFSGVSLYKGNSLPRKLLPFC